ncbi:MAG: DUF983 domain-containing protein [Chloroflexi bacterium]|nr:DUF983 domain-containing protein [Chloroflexota bacterium]
MYIRRLLNALRVLKTGLFLRCPRCGLGKMAAGWFRFHATCPYCGARYERGSGESVGGLYITVALAEISALLGFFVVDALATLDALAQLPFWVLYTLAFCALFYRCGRGLWIAIVHLTGGVYPDPDYTREYQRPQTDITPASKSSKKD